MGKIIIIDGLDGTGKATQVELLKSRLIRENYYVEMLDFPMYQEESSYFVREYLSGSYGKDPNSVTAKQASFCYAMDRFHYFKKNEKHIKEVLEDPNAVFLGNRYTTSNALYQGAKLPKEEREVFLDWLFNLEYNEMAIPRPDEVIMSYIPFEVSTRLMQKRGVAETSSKNNMKTDIHENDLIYMRQVFDASLDMANSLGFKLIDCYNPLTDDIRTKEDINEEIYKHVKTLIK